MPAGAHDRRRGRGGGVECREQLRGAATAVDLAERVSRDAVKRVVEAQEQERALLARELHDETGQALTSILLGLKGLEDVVDTSEGSASVAALREHARNVKHWQNGEMRLRWAAAGMLVASTQFRRVKGYRQLPALALALQRAVGAETPSTIAVSA